MCCLADHLEQLIKHEEYFLIEWGIFLITLSEVEIGCSGYHFQELFKSGVLELVRRRFEHVVAGVEGHAEAVKGIFFEKFDFGVMC
jgi:hypothetical protein